MEARIGFYNYYAIVMIKTSCSKISLNDGTIKQG